MMRLVGWAEMLHRQVPYPWCGDKEGISWLWRFLPQPKEQGLPDSHGLHSLGYSDGILFSILKIYSLSTIINLCLLLVDKVILVAFLQFYFYIVTIFVFQVSNFTTPAPTPFNLPPAPSFFSILNINFSLSHPGLNSPLSIYSSSILSK